MKKIITLVGAVLLVSFSFAQYHSDNQSSRDAVYSDNWNRDHGRDRHDDRYDKFNRERDMKIAKINRQYDHKIESVRHRWFMSLSKKEAIIYHLENDRREEIRNVYAKYNWHNDRYDDHDSRRGW